MFSWLHSRDRSSRAPGPRLHLEALDERAVPACCGVPDPPAANEAVLINTVNHNPQDDAPVNFPDALSLAPRRL